MGRIKVSDIKKKPAPKIQYQKELANAKEVREIIAKYPTYPIYLRSGFKYRGAKERLETDKGNIERFCKWFAACDIVIQNNELHLNGFSIYDMEQKDILKIRNNEYR